MDVSGDFGSCCCPTPVPPPCLRKVCVACPTHPLINFSRIVVSCLPRHGLPWWSRDCMRADFGVLTYLMHLLPVITLQFDPDLSAFVSKAKVGIQFNYRRKYERGCYMLHALCLNITPILEPAKTLDFLTTFSNCCRSRCWTANPSCSLWGVRRCNQG